MSFAAERESVHNVVAEAWDARGGHPSQATRSSTCPPAIDCGGNHMSLIGLQTNRNVFATSLPECVGLQSPPKLSQVSCAEALSVVSCSKRCPSGIFLSRRRYETKFLFYSMSTVIRRIIF